VSAAPIAVNEFSRICRLSVVAVRLDRCAGSRHSLAHQASVAPARLHAGGGAISPATALEPNAPTVRFPRMRTVLLILALWCVPSVLLVGVRLWHLQKATLRLRQLRLDLMLSHTHHQRHA
jgi:hypothetical protein